MGTLVTSAVAQGAAANAPVISVEALSLRFGGTIALDNVSFDIRENELLALIGPNGSGKTSTLNCLTGFYQPQLGSIRYKGEQLVGQPAHQIARKGVCRTFQKVELFAGLTVIENLMVARHNRMRQGVLGGGLFFGPARSQEVANRRIVEEVIDFMELEQVRKAPVGALPYGLRKRIGVARALAMEPEVLLLDEPMAGMNVEEKEDLVRFVLDIHRGARFGYESEFLNRGVRSIVLIEHDMGIVMDIADRIVVLDFGSKIGEGAPHEIAGDDAVVKAYLGDGI
jgi:branched-chain amino acid transport system ATP-binding protein